MTVLISQNDAVVTLTLNRPAVRNAIDPSTARALFEAFRNAENDKSVSVIVLTGAGGNFCAGADLKAVAAGEAFEHRAHGPMGPSRLLSDRANAHGGITLSKPMIAAIEGFSVAGGLELAMLADMRVASATAVFGVFCRRWGVPLIDGGTVRLPRIIGQGRAMDMILTGRPVNAQEAHQWGLANRLTPAGEALAQAQKLAAEIALFPQLCLRGDRASCYAGWSRELDAALHSEAEFGRAALEHEARRGAARFSQGAGRNGDFDQMA